MKCNFRFEKEEKTGKIFRRKKIIVQKCRLQLRVAAYEGSTSYYEECDLDDCIFMKLFNQ